MALFGSFGGLINTGLNVLGLQGGALGAAGNLGSSLLTGFAQSRAPQMPAVIPVAAAAPRIAQQGATMFQAARGIGRGMLSTAAAGGLIKIAQKLGRSTMSVRTAIKMIRRLGKFLQPAGIALALGITVSELGEIILAAQSMPRRRMNPANAKALRRAHRRLESFHRLAQKNDILRSPRSRSRKKACPPGSPLVVRGG